MALHPDALAQQRVHQQADPVGAGGQAARQIGGAVVNAEVETQLVNDSAALGSAAGDAHHAAALGFGDLAH